MFSYNSLTIFYKEHNEQILNYLNKLKMDRVNNTKDQYAGNNKNIKRTISLQDKDRADPWTKKMVIGTTVVKESGDDGIDLLTPPHTPLDSRSPGIEENAILNDPNSLPNYISYPRNEEELWSNLGLERLFNEEESIDSNRTSNNSTENNLTDNDFSISNESSSTVDDNEYLNAPSNNSSISESTTENVIDNLQTEQIEPNNEIINIGIQIGREGPWHVFSADRLFTEHINDALPLQIQIIFGLITTGTLLNIYFRSMRPFIDLMRPDARSINYFNRAERMTNIRSARLLRQIWP